jgi:hypothetical protein
VEVYRVLWGTAARELTYQLDFATEAGEFSDIPMVVYGGFQRDSSSLGTF